MPFHNPSIDQLGVVHVHPFIRTHLKDFTKRASEEIAPAQIFDNLEKESDRGVVVVAVTLIEDALTASLRTHFKQFNKKEFAEFTQFSGVGGTFSAKIKIAYGAGLISAEIRDFVDLAREIRNACAHSRGEIGFHTPALRGVLPRLFPGEGSTPVEDWPPSQARAMFIMACVTTSEVISGGLPLDGSQLIPDSRASAMLRESGITLHAAIIRIATKDVNHCGRSRPLTFTTGERPLRRSFQDITYRLRGPLATARCDDPARV